MIYLLAGALFFTLVIAFILSKCDIFSPWVIITASFFNSTCLAMLNVDYWGFTFHLNTCIVILTGVILFGCGSIFSNYAFQGEEPLNISFTEFNMRRVHISLVCCTLFILILSYISLELSYRLSVQYGNTGGYSNIVRTLRPLIENKVFVFPSIFSYMGLIGAGLSYVFLAIGINNSIAHKVKIKNLIFLFPLFAYVPMILLSTGRVMFLQVMIFIVVCVGLLYQRKYGYSKKVTLKMLGCFCGMMLLFFIMFFSAGHLTGKIITEDRTPFIIISHYTGAQIPALDIQLNSFLWNDTNNIGGTTLLGLYGNLRKLGIELPETSMFLPFIQLKHVTTNVYTSLFRYIRDYGMLGMCAITFFLGMFYTTIYNLIKYRYKSFSLLVVYAVICMPLFLFGHDEIFFTGVLISRNVYLFIMMMLLIRFLRMKKGV